MPTSLTYSFFLRHLMKFIALRNAFIKSVKNLFNDARKSADLEKYLHNTSSSSSTN
jgi:hypothetical protein